MSTKVESRCDGCERSMESFVQIVFAEIEGKDMQAIGILTFKDKAFTALSVDRKTNYDFCSKECLQIWVDQTGNSVKDLDESRILKPKPSN